MPTEDKVTFSYAFAAPHTMALCRPSASEKYVASISSEAIGFQYSTKNLKNNYPLTWVTLPFDFETSLKLSLGSSPLPFSSWRRHESGAPILVAECEGAAAVTLTAAGCEAGVIIRLDMRSASETRQDVGFRFDSRRGWVISNLGWIDCTHNNLLLTMQGGRADRIIALARGADAYPMFRDGKPRGACAPMSAEYCAAQGSSMMFMTALFSLDAGQSKTGYIILPYEAYFADLEALEALDCERQLADALAEWEALLNRSSKIEINEPDALFCYKSCLADIFAMREQMSPNHFGIGCGTNVYRSANSGEPLLAETMLERIGYSEAASEDLGLYLEEQDESGCWVSSKGWEHDCWGAAYNKCRAALEHYYVTRDRAYLESVYPRMKASALFNAKSRESTEADPEPAFRGLMHRGMGDCGMMNNGDYYGVFYPANAQTIAADKLTLRAAQILGLKADAELLSESCLRAERAFVTSLRANSVKEDGAEWIPAIAKAANTSLYGCLFAYCPAGLLPADDPLIAGTVRHIMSKALSSGGLPLGTGWLEDGIWAAMALDNFSSCFLRMGDGDAAASFLYPVLNHASPLVTWCEERGAEAGSTVKTGDMQHLWTPLSVCAYMLDALLYEDDDCIHLCAGTPRSWLKKGGRIAVTGLKTHCGECSFAIVNRGSDALCELSLQYPAEKKLLLHLRTPEITCCSEIACGSSTIKF